MAVPLIRAVGAVASNVAAIAPGLPTGTVSGDGLIMLVETFAQAITASGWDVEFEVSQTTLTRCTVLSRIATGTDATTTSDSGQHQIGRIIGIQAGTFDPADFPHAVGAGNTQTSTTSVSIDGVTTTKAECLILACSVSDLPDAVSTTEFGTPTNASLTNLTERMDNATDAGNGGAIYMASGELASAGPSGTTTLTASNAGVRSNVTIAICPPGASAVELESDVAITFVTTGVLKVTKQGTGASTLLFAPTATLKTTKQLASALSIIFSPTATLQSVDAAKELVASLTILFTPVSSLLTIKELRTVAAIIFSPTATLKTEKRFTASSVIQFAGVQEMKVTKQLVAATELWTP